MGSYDTVRRKRAKRSGREAGCWVYIAAEELERAGFDPRDEPPVYRAWGARHSTNTGRVIVSLYREV